MCPGCQHSLGALRRKSQVMLDKWEIIVLTTDTASFGEQAPWVTYAALDILSLARTHASYRFILQPKGTSEPVLGYLWLMHGRTLVTGSSLDGQGPQDVLRLLYRSINDHPDQVGEEWREGEEGVEVLTWSRPQVLELFESLRRSTALSNLSDQGSFSSSSGPFTGFIQGFLPL